MILNSSVPQFPRISTPPKDVEKSQEMKIGTEIATTHYLEQSLAHNK